MTLLFRLIGLMNRRTREVVPALNVKRFVTLSYLEDRGRMSQQALADAACMDANNLVLLLNELEASGYVRRVRDPADRRRHFVEITPDGSQAFRTAEREMNRLEGEVLSALTLEERITLRELLNRAVLGAETQAVRAGS